MKNILKRTSNVYVFKMKTKTSHDEIGDIVRVSKDYYNRWLGRNLRTDENAVYSWDMMHIPEVMELITQW